jgi:hypothetical protein
MAENTNNNSINHTTTAARDRQGDLKAWLAERGLSLSMIGKRIGVTAQGVHWMLRSKTIHPHRHAQLLGLGIPVKLLPEPDLPQYGPRRGRCEACDGMEDIEGSVTEND